eukprot:375752_1
MDKPANCYHNSNYSIKDLLKGKYVNVHNSMQSPNSFCIECALQIYLMSNTEIISLLHKGIEYDIYIIELLIHPQILKQFAKKKKLFKILIQLITSRIDFYSNMIQQLVPINQSCKSINIDRNCAKWMDILYGFTVYSSQKKHMKCLWNMNNGYFINKYVIGEIKNYINNKNQKKKHTSLYHEFTIICARYFY